MTVVAHDQEVEERIKAVLTTQVEALLGACQPRRTVRWQT